MGQSFHKKPLSQKSKDLGIARTALPKGVYVFEYSTRVQHRGQYQTGVAEIQCMYAPEFNSHSESLGLLVR
jgi:uncharacterized protein YfaS (alpha-2-macroglobulin family)